MSVNPKPPPKFDVLREKIRHENDLINHRISWMILCHGLLLNAYVTRMPKAGTKELLAGIALCGLAISATGFLALLVSDKAISHIAEAADPIPDKNGRKTRDDPNEGVFGYDISSRWCKEARFMFPWFVIPKVSAIGWVVLMARLAIF